MTQAIAVFTDDNLEHAGQPPPPRGARSWRPSSAAPTVQLKAKVELDRVKRHLEAVLTAIPTGVVVYDAAGRVIRANDAATEILGTDRDLADAAAMAAVAGDVTDGSPTEVTCGDGAVRVLARRRSTASRRTRKRRDRDHRGSDRARARPGALAPPRQDGHPQDHGRRHRPEIQPPPRSRASPSALPRAVHRRWSGPARRPSARASQIEGIVASMLGIAAGRARPGDLRGRRDAEDAVDAARLGREGLALDRQLDVEAGRITADRIKLRQAVRNLVANAYDAQPGGGRVLVRAHETAAGVRLAVADDGPGIGTADAHRLCDLLHDPCRAGSGPRARPARGRTPRRQPRARAVRGAPSGRVLRASSPAPARPTTWTAAGNRPHRSLIPRRNPDPP